MWSTCVSLPGGVTPFSDFLAGTVLVPQSSQTVCPAFCCLLASITSCLPFLVKSLPALSPFFVPCLTAFEASETVSTTLSSDKRNKPNTLLPKLRLSPVTKSVPVNVSISPLTSPTPGIKSKVWAASWSFSVWVRVDLWAVA